MCASVVLASGSIAASQAEQEVTNAVHAVYSALNAKDADALTELIVGEGYTEYNGSGGPIVLISPQLIREAFDSDASFNYAAEQIDVAVTGQSAIVTGYRVGTYTSPEGQDFPGTLRLSMFWVNDSGKWLLAHVHLSPTEAGRGNEE